MFMPKIRTVLGGLIVTALATATGIAEAANKPGIVVPHVQKAPPSVAREVQVAPTGDGPADDAECAKYEKAINSWADYELDAVEIGYEKEARRAKRNVDGLIAEATDRGCFIIY